MGRIEGSQLIEVVWQFGSELEKATSAQLRGREKRKSGI